MQKIVLLTSDELSSERNSIVDAEATLRPHGKTILLLIKTNVADFICASRCSSCHFVVSFKLFVSVSFRKKKISIVKIINNLLQRIFIKL